MYNLAGGLLCILLIRAVNPMFSVTPKRHFPAAAITGSLFRQQKRQPLGCLFVREAGLDLFLAVLPTNDRFQPTPIRVRSEIYGLSHGLNKCPPDTCLPSLRSGRPFKSRLRNQKENGYPFGYPFLFGARGGT